MELPDSKGHGATMNDLTMDIETRVNLSLAVNRYLRAKDRFEQASDEFNKACSEIRKTIPQDTKFIVKDAAKHYLVEMNRQDFGVKAIEFI